MSERNSRFCPICGSPLSSTDRVCNTCGSEVVENTAPPEVPRAAQNRNYTPWIFFGLGFFLGVYAVENLLPNPYLSWSLGSSSSSVGIPILFGILSLISIGIGVYFLVLKKKSDDRSNISFVIAKTTFRKIKISRLCVLSS